MGTRREAVRLEVEGNFVGDMAAAAASVAVLRRELDSLGRMRISTNINQSMSSIDRGARQADSSINQLTGRLSLLADAALILGPGLVPIAAVGAQALGGLATAASAAAVAGGSAIVAFQGVGDAVKALNEYQLNPTVQTFEKAREAMEKIGPQAQRFVKEFQGFRPVLTDIQRAAAKGWFPGLSESLDDFARLAPRVERIFLQVGRAGADIVQEGAASLASHRWRGFFDYLERELPSAMRSLGETVGALTHGLAKMMQALDPSNDSFLKWINDVAKGFDSWASSSQGRDDIQSFMDYARENGPAVRDFFLALVDAVTQITQAAAPLSGPILQSLTKILEAVAAFADSDLGTPFITALVAVRLYTRSLMLAQAAQARLLATSAARPIAGTVPVAGQAGFIGPLAQGQTAAAAGPTRLGAAIGNVGPMAAALAGAATIQMAAAANNEFVDSAKALQDSVDSLDFSSFRQQSKDLVEQQQALNDKLNGDGSLGSAIKQTFDPGAYKNAIEGVFGKSDVEEAADEMERLSKRALGAQQVVAAMGRAAGMTVGPLDGSTRSLEQLDRIVEKITPKLEKLGITQDDLVGVRALKDGGGFFGPGAAAALKNVQGELGKTERSIRGVVAATDTWAESLAKAQGFLTRNQAIDSSIQAWQNFKKALKENGDAFDRFSKKGQANRQNLRDWATAGLNAADQLKGLARVNFINNLRKQFLEAADRLNLSQEQTQRWGEKLGLLSRQRVTPLMVLQDGQFNEAYSAAIAKLRELDGQTAITYIRTVRTGALASDGIGPGRADEGSGSADGVDYRGGVRTSTTSTSATPVRSGQQFTSTSGKAAMVARGSFRGTGAATNTSVGGGRDEEDRERDRTARSLKGLRRELDKTTNALTKAKDKRQEFLSIRSEVGQSLTDSLTGGGLAGFDLAVSAGRNDTRRAIKALIELKKKGLDGPLFDLVAGSGDSALILEFANLSRKQIAQRERQYGQLTANQNRLGGIAAEAQLGTTLSALNSTIKKLNQKIDSLEDRVERGARNGTGKKNRQRDREATTRTRGGR